VVEAGRLVALMFFKVMAEFTGAQAKAIVEP
jgi:hypothetical protein